MQSLMNCLFGFSVGRTGYTAGVDDSNISLTAERHPFKPGFLKLTADFTGFREIQLASQGMKSYLFQITNCISLKQVAGQFCQMAPFAMHQINMCKNILPFQFISQIG